MATTVLVVVSMTQKLLGTSLVRTYACFPSGVIAIGPGKSPAGIVSTTVLVAVRITETLLPNEFTT
jgi:hypothetical protein